MSDCIFCKIVNGEIPSTKVYSDDQVTAFRDINPAAPTHILVIPNRHIPSINDIEEGDQALMGYMMLVIKKIAAQEGIAEGGYRLIVNTGPAANQVVFHIHIHILGGARLKHPMG